MNATVVYLVLMWGASIKGVEQIATPHSSSACDLWQAATAGPKGLNSKVLAIRVQESVMTYAVMCYPGSCPTPLPSVSASEVSCVFDAPSVSSVTIQNPGGWRLKP